LADVIKTKSNHENAPSGIAPLRASEIEASVELTPPLADGSQVQEKVTKAAVVDIERYVHLADKLLAENKQGKESEHGSRPKAA
jgi:hypothetical protein